MTKSFAYKLIGTGWAEATICNQESCVTLIASYLNNLLLDLFQALYRLKQSISDKELVCFVDEPGECVMTIERTSLLSVELRIVRNDEWEKFESSFPTTQGRKQLIYSDSDLLENFIEKVSEGIDNLLNKISITEYHEAWVQDEFPLEEYKIIRYPKLLR